MSFSSRKLARALVSPRHAEKAYRSSGTLLSRCATTPAECQRTPQRTPSTWPHAPAQILTVTADSLAAWPGRVSDDATYTRYIAERPGVIADGEAHDSSTRTACPNMATVTG